MVSLHPSYKLNHVNLNTLFYDRVSEKYRWTKQLQSDIFCCRNPSACRVSYTAIVSRARNTQARIKPCCICIEPWDANVTQCLCLIKAHFLPGNTIFWRTNTRAISNPDRSTCSTHKRIIHIYTRFILKKLKKCVSAAVQVKIGHIQIGRWDRIELCRVKNCYQIIQP